jgi:phosphoribosylanthranilate isomerase
MFVKICGITSEDDALLSVALGADAVGFVFAPSPRQIAPQVAGDIAKRLPPEIVTVGVFRDSAAERVLNVAHLAGLGAVQLHGREPPSVSRWLRAKVPMVIQAFAAGDARVRRANEYGAHVIMLDAPSPGSAQVFDWSLAAEVPPGHRVMIAGGLNPLNVGAAIARTRPWAVDVSSGVERQPGIKDPIKLREFIEAARLAADALDSDHGDRDQSGDKRTGSEGPEPYDWQEDE